MTEFELLDELSLSNSIFEIITSKCTSVVKVMKHLIQTKIE